ncbi:MAG: 23S rRNA (adenine(2030)-N(6))-methyltransferase RlmJ [Pseudomonadota bacterium]
MNYRHIYHAGNFCDVMKHIVLMRLVDYLKRKDKPFRVIDTHAGIGIYDLTSDEAQKTGEWRNGIGRVISTPADARPGPVSAYCDLVSGGEPRAEVKTYPGSPKIARLLLRPQDRLTLTELHDADFSTLKEHFRDDHQTKVIHLDGWLALKSFLPPKEKRGLVLIDPPFEIRNDFDVMATRLSDALRKWQGGTYALWYPIKDQQSVNTFLRRCRDLPAREGLNLQLCVRNDSVSDRLNGSGMVIINPPYILAEDLKPTFEFLANHLAQDDHARYLVNEF